MYTSSAREADSKLSQHPAEPEAEKENTSHCVQSFISTLRDIRAKIFDRPHQITS